MYFVVNKINHSMHPTANNHISVGSDDVILEVPNGIAPGNCKVQDDNGTLSLVDMGQNPGKETQNSNPFWVNLRAERDAKLSECDWTQLADAPLNDNQKASWASYRAALRNVPATCTGGDPEAPVWPVRS
jgi:hypothetical protein